jgi:hypothetical protein
MVSMLAPLAVAIINTVLVSCTKKNVKTRYPRVKQDRHSIEVTDQGQSSPPISFSVSQEGGRAHALLLHEKEKGGRGGENLRGR